MTKEINTLLEMMLRPALYVAEGKIVKCNAAAQAMALEAGSSIASLILTGQEELEGLNQGCLYLQLSLPGGTQNAAVTPLGDGHIFVLDQAGGELQALSLAAKELRDPVNNLLAISANLLPAALPDADPKVRNLLGRMSKGLYQLHRVLGNMTDGAHAPEMTCQEVRNLSQVFDDIFEKAAAYLSLSGVQLSFKGLNQDVYGLIDLDMIERSILNILSNAMKFLPQTGEIQAELTRKGNTLRLSIQDNGPGIPEDILASLFHRYLRQPGIEDSRYGLGLGMVMIRAAAASHGGTILVDSPQGAGTRVTMTLRIRQDTCPKVQSPRQDILGGRNQALIELSDFLPVSAYKTEL